MSPFLYPPPNNAPVVIVEDGGGLVDKYIEQAHQYALEKRRVEIRGSCRSACIMALSVPKVCVAPGAVVKAHHAYEQRTGNIRPDVTNKMLSELPANVRDRLQGHIYRNYQPDSVLDYSDLRQLNIPDCDNKKVLVKNETKNQGTMRNIKFKILNPLDIIFKTIPNVLGAGK